MGTWFRRCFYPVGHGGFAAEFFDDFTMVYDCGSKTKLSEQQKNKIFTNFSKYCKKNGKKGVIDVLFISHFDKDHVSFLERINKGFEIKDVYMPFLTKCQQKIHQAFYAEGSVSHKLVSGKIKFSHNTKIHFVKTIDDEHIEFSNDLMYPDADIVNSFDNVFYDVSACLFKWGYIPFMARWELEDRFWEKCSNEALDVDLLKKSYNHSLPQVEVTEALKYIEENSSVLRKVYNSMPGKSNGNSLMVFSGCSCSIEHRNACKAGCLYTGDADGKVGVRKQKDIYSLFYKKINSNGYVYTLQVPHHGSASSWGRNMEKFDCQNAVIQYQDGDTKRPASSIINHCASKGIKLAKVTEIGEVFTQQYGLTINSICDCWADWVFEDL